MFITGRAKLVNLEANDCAALNGTVTLWDINLCQSVSVQ